MKFENPLVGVYIVWIIPIIILFWMVIFRIRKKRAAIFINKPIWKELLTSFDIRRRYIKAALLSISLLLLLLALTRPQWGFIWEKMVWRGLDIIIAVDTSKSMLAEDITPNRLERCKLGIKEMIADLKADRVGLIAFAGTSFLQCPLTVDYDGFMLALDDLDVDTIPRGSTSISAAIYEAIKVFEPDEKGYQVLVLITDGEEQEGDAVKAAAKAKEEKVKIFCTGVGSEEGSLIPITDENGYKTFLKDANGNNVKSRLNENLLKRIAFMTDGAYVRSTKLDFGLADLYKNIISKLERREGKADMRKRYHERFQIPLSLAIFLLCLEMLISERRPH